MKMKNSLLVAFGVVAVAILLLQILILVRLDGVMRSAESAEVSAMDAMEYMKRLAKENPAPPVVEQRTPTKWSIRAGKPARMEGVHEMNSGLLNTSPR